MPQEQATAGCCSAWSDLTGRRKDENVKEEKTMKGAQTFSAWRSVAENGHRSKKQGLSELPGGSGCLGKQEGDCHKRKTHQHSALVNKELRL